MKAVKARLEEGRLVWTEPPPSTGPIDVLVVFPEPADDRWQQILDDPTPRPELNRWIQEVEAEIASGKTVPLDLGQL